MDINVRVVKRLEKRLEVPGTVLLIKDNWNDWWEYQNQYYAHYVNLSGRLLELGRVKIEDPELPEQDKPEHPLPAGFNKKKIGSAFVSLGQTDFYYQTLSELPIDEREAFCLSMRDAVWDSRRIKKYKRLPAVRKSLLRDVPLSSVNGELVRILREEGETNYYHLRYYIDNLKADFIVNPTCKPRTNLHAIIGRNGVGKTTLLRRVTAILATGEEEEGEELSVLDVDGMQADDGVIAGIQYVSWGPFDEFHEAQNWRLKPGVSYAQVGINGILRLEPNGKLEEPQVEGFDEAFTGEVKKSPSATFARTFGLVVQRVRNNFWLDAIDSLDSDPEFKRLRILESLKLHLTDDDTDEGLKLIDYDAIASEFKDLSEGHQAVLLTVTYVAATLAEQTLVVLDEPEAHLHPPLLSSLIRCLGELLARKNSMCVVATHSPVVLQEIPRDCALVISGQDETKTARPPRIETYGEDIGALTHEVFGLEVEDSGFYRTLKELASRYDHYDEALEYLDGKLGVVGRSVLRSLIGSEHNAEDIG